MADWDPMLLDYQDTQFNAYMQGVGRDLTNGNGRGTKLFVDNCPVELGQDGFFNLFAEFGQVLYARLKPSNREDGKLTFGFVTMDSPVAAERAISQWNGRSLRSGAKLIVRPALSDEQKKRRDEKRLMEAEFMANLGRSNFNRDDDIMSSVSGFASQDFLFDQRALTAKARAILEKTGHAHDLDKYLGGYGPEIGRGYSPIRRESSLYHGRGRAQMCRGTDTQQYREPRHDFGDGPFGGRGRGRGLSTLDQRFKPGPGLSQRPNPSLNLGRGLLSQFSQPRRPKAENFRICINCGTEDSAYRCQACKSYYCSHECQHKDWARHKDICLDINIHNFNLHQQNDVDHHNSVASRDRGYESEAGGVAKKRYDERQFVQRGKRKDEEYGNERYKRKDEECNYGNIKHKDGEQKVQRDKYKFEGHSGDRYKRRDEEPNYEKLKHTNAELGHERERKGHRPHDNSTTNKPQTEQHEFENKKRTPLKFNKKDRPSQDKGENQKRLITGPANSSNSRDIQTEKINSPKSETNVFKNKSEEDKRGNNAKVGSVVEAGSEDASCDLLVQNMEVGAAVKGYISHFDSPSKFWIVLAEDVADFLSISEDFKRLLLELPKTEVTRVKPGEIYCMVDADLWARVKVVTVGQGGNVTVFFLDVGKQESIHISQLFHLEDTMSILPSQAICCCIGNAKPKGKIWNEKATSVVQKWLGDPYCSEMPFKVLSKKGNTHAVEITKKGENLSEVLISQGLAEVSDANANLPSLTNKNCDESVSEKRFMAKHLKGQAACLEEGDQVSINITEVKSLTFFMGHIINSSTKKALSEMSAIIKGLDLDKGAPHMPIQGELVLAKYSLDNAWYRSEVIKIREDKFQVLFLDYGNVDIVTAKDTRRIKDERLSMIPTLAASLQLWGVDPAVHSKETVTDKFGELLSRFSVEEGKWTIVIKSKKEMSLKVDFVSWAQEETLSVLLNKSVTPKKAVSNSPLVKASVSSKDSGCSSVKSLACDALPSGVNFRAILTFVNSCSSFYIMHEDKSHALIPLMEKIQTEEKSFPVQNNPAVGNIVITFFSEDKLWYRAQIKNIMKSQNKCDVFYLDYGNCGVVPLEDLRQVPQWASSDPACASHVGLDMDSVNLSPDASDQFKCIEGSVVTVSVLRKEESGEKYIVKIICDDGSDILQILTLQPDSEQVKSSSSPTTTNSPQPLHKAESRIEAELLPVSDEPIMGIFSHIESVCNFYIIASYSQELTDVMYKLQSTANHEPQVTDVHVGMHCLAKFAEDGEWYRSLVTSSIDCSDVCTVKFIDHGNCQETLKKELHKLPDSAKAFPAMSVPCCFKEFEEYLGQSKDLARIQSSVEVDKMKIELPNTQVMVTVLGQKSGVSIVTLMDSDGNNLLSKYEAKTSPSVTQPKLANEQLAVVTGQPVTVRDIPVAKMTATSFEVVPTNMESLTEFFCQGKETHIAKALEISATLKLDMDSCGPHKCQAVKGGVYACLYQNDWYRCVVEEVSGETVRIQYIDWGNKEDREMSDLRPLQLNHLTFPVSLMKCQLHGVEIMQGEQEYIQVLNEKLLSNQLWVDIVDQQEDVYSVSLSVCGEDRKVSIVEDLIDLGIAKALEDDAEDEEDVEKRLLELQKQMELLRLKKSKKK